jgi:hypothetical protein
MSRIDGIKRVCAKVYGRDPGGNDADLFVPIFHDWIREQTLDLVMFDVADYAHAPDSPGIVLVCYEETFALDRSDGSFGVLGQRRAPTGDEGQAAVVRIIRDTILVSKRLEEEPTLAGKLAFDFSSVRVEANDRLRAPNTDEGFAEFAALVASAAGELFPGGSPKVSRIVNDPRDRLSVELRMEGMPAMREFAAV